MKDLVSIIIPVYNVEKYIEKCVISLLNQTYNNCEFIFINDGTKDDSVNIIKKFKDDRIILIEQSNQGVSSARNAGLKKSKGKYIMFLDADDYVANDYVEYLYDLISKNDADFAYTTNLYQSKNDIQIDKDYIEIIDGKKSSGLLLSPDVVVGCYNKIYKKSIIDNNKLQFRTDLFYGEGLNFIIRMSLVSNKVAVGKRRVLYYRKNNISSATTKYNNEKYINGLKSLEIIKEMIDFDDDYVKSMFIIHISTFYLGAITKTIEYKKVKMYKESYNFWKKQLKANIPFVLKNKYISNYRKIMILSGYLLPNTMSKLNKNRSKKIIEKSV